MVAYLKGNKAVEGSLIKGLELTQKTRLMGHGYDGYKDAGFDVKDLYELGGL